MFDVVCLERCNIRNFEDCKRMMAELKAIMFKNLFIFGWQLTTTHYSFLEFMELFFSTS
jgi:hypothetical protein